MEPSLLEAVNLRCIRGNRRLFDHLGFEIKPGGCLVVKGRNGSGKTSLLRMIAGLTPPAEGSIHWKGRPILPLSEQYTRNLVFIGHRTGLKKELSAVENLMFAAELSGQPVSRSAACDALEQAGLRAKQDHAVRTLSQGQERRVGLARLVLLKRPLWILDEPLASLDDHAADWLTATIDRHLNGGGAAVLTTHQEMALTHAVQTVRVGA